MALLAALTAVVLAGCSQDGDDAGTDAAAPGGGQADEGDAGGGGGGQGADPGDPRGFIVEASSRQQLPDADREVIHTAQLEVETGDVDSAGLEAADLAASLGGFVHSQEASLVDDPQLSIVLKVPPDRFGDALEGIAALGDVTHRVIDAEDVTSEVVDLDARLSAAQASANRLRDLLAQSGTVGDLVTVEQHLAQRESEVESLTGQLRSLRARVDLATVSASFTERARERVRPSGDIPGFLRGLRAGAVSFVNAAQVAATVLGFLLPYLALAALVAFPARSVRRRLRRCAPS